MKIYYAHPMSWYGTIREEMDMTCIRENTPMSVEIVNPNNQEFRDQVAAIKMSQSGGQLSDGKFDIMKLFVEAVAACDAIAYRTFDDGSIGAGVANELLTAAVHGKQILRLRTGDLGKVRLIEERFGLSASFGPRLLTIVQTRDYTNRGVM